MSNCAPYITDLANSIWNDLGGPSEISVAYIQTKLTSEAFLGQLNATLSVCHEIIDGQIIPPLDEQEQGIYSLMYQSQWWAKKAAQLMAGNDLAFITLAEGDSRITRVDSVNQARLYKDMNKQINDQLIRLAASYRGSKSGANSVDAPNVVNNWFGYGSNIPGRGGRNWTN